MIRAISVSLLAIAALVASVALSNRLRRPPSQEIENEDLTEGTVSLEALRQAGL